MVRISKRMRISGVIAVMFFLPLAGACLLTTSAEAAQAYTPHDVIQIDGDSGFVAENGVTGGQGTEEDPFIIEGWVINASMAAGAAGGIQISHTDAHFKIRNVRVEFGGALYTGIWLSNVRNGWIEDSVLVDNYEGITLNSTVNLTIKTNTLVNNFFCGIYAVASECVYIEFNEINESRHGVYSHICEQVRIVDNAIYDNEYGVYLNCTSNSSVSGNDIARNQYGVYLTECNDIDLIENSLVDNDVPVFDSSSSNGDDEPDSHLTWGVLSVVLATVVVVVCAVVALLLRRRRRLR